MVAGAIGMLRRKLHFGRTYLPAWVLMVGAMTVLAVAGQAVGPVLSGSVQGSAGAVVSQALIVKPGSSGNTVTGADDYVITTNDEGTSFTVAMETKVGKSQKVYLVLENKSGKPANGIVEINAPAGIEVDVDEVGSSDVTALAQLSRNTYLFTMGAYAVANDLPDLAIEIEAKDDASPGYYSITARIIQVAN
ncbi:MAG: hypothetical protein HYY01_00070 [Chloroflexi bacterium]|nr:hypothetical protein [Chloroflexota bacterium]